MKCMCLQAMTIVYGKCFDEIGQFNDTKYIVQLLERVSQFSVDDSISLIVVVALRGSDAVACLEQNHVIETMLSNF